MHPSPPRQIEAKSSMPLLPPKLPRLYFEQDSVDQIDFAYSRSNPKPPSRPNVNGTSAENVERTTNSRPEKRAPPRPSPPPIDTRTSQERNGSRGSNAARTPDQEDENEDDNEDGAGARGSSFYWHSPQSTENGDESPRPFDNEDDTENTSKEDVGQKDDEKPRAPLVIKPFISSVPDNGLTSASALGFGGPSDWMHFNDYDATEEVDDLALYTSNKPKTAELPAGTPKEEEANKLEASLSPRRLMNVDRDVLPTIQERASEVLDDESKNSAAEQQPHSETSSIKDSTPLPGNASSSSQEAITAPPVVAPIVTAAVTAPSITSQSESTPSSTVQQETQNDSPSTESSSQLEDPRPAPPGEKTPSPEPKARDQAAQSQENAEQRSSQPSSVHTRVLSNHSSQLNSPIDDDDGKEQIFISLQVPDTPAPDKAEPPEPAEETSQERQPSPATNVDVKNLESPELLRSARKSVFPPAAEMEHPYDGLEPWAKASLNRYVKMLKEEAAAETEEEKFTIFINFTHKETKNRTVLYNMEDESDMSEHPNKAESVRDKDGNLRPKISVRSKNPPTVPPKNEPVPPLPQQNPVTRAETMPIQRVPVPSETPPKSADAGSGEPAHKVSHERMVQQPPATAPPHQSNFAPQQTSDESFVMVDSPATDDKGQFLSQGKPKQVREKQSGQLKEKGSGHLKEKPGNQAKENKAGGKSGTSLASLKKALDLVSRSGGSKEKGGQPSNLQTLLAKAGEEGKKSTPTKVSEKTEQEKTASSNTVTPEKSHRTSEGEGRAYEGDKAANRQTIYRPFSGLLRQSSVQQGSADGGSKRSSVFDRKSTAADSGSAGKSPNAFDRPVEEFRSPTRAVNYRYTILEPLLLVIPQQGVLHQEPPQLSRLRQATTSIPDDFSFIHKTVLAWDAEAKKARERYEHERHARQQQNEQRIETLFNEHEIGYADISQLETEYKRQDGAKKAEEDREEVDTFVHSVFDVVWARINYEMDQLTPLYEECTQLVANASAGRGMFEDAEERIPIAPAMDILLALYQKLMIRHQKAFEAVLERDRRIKKTEVAPWHAIGSADKVRRIEKRFEDAEKKAILEFCRQRDERANLLMDVLDQNTLRGVGANQDYMESIMQAVRKIGNELAMGADLLYTATGGNSRKDGKKGNKTSSIGDDDIVSVDEVLKAQTITALLADSSTQIVQTFHHADMLLNAADYEVSVANAKLSNADAAAFKRLREAKAKEDSKLLMDLEHRLSLIRGDTDRTQEEIGKLLALIGKKDGRGNSIVSERGGRGSLGEADSRGSAESGRMQQPQGGAAQVPGGGVQNGGGVMNDREKEARMHRALDDAKRRNGRKG